MKIFFVGDFSTETGSAMVNKLIAKALPSEKAIYSKAENKVFRIFEFIFKLLTSDCVCFCSYSNLNFFGLKLARQLKIKSFYLMHGYKTYEVSINNQNISQEKLELINKQERKIFESVDKVFCVSEKFMNFMKKAEPKYKEKFDYNYNPIDIDKIVSNSISYEKTKKNNQIVSIGGGMKRKNNLAICKAIDQLNRTNGLNLKFIVIGLPFTDKEAITSYDFVTYYDKLSHEEVLKFLSESYLYIQNSTFETFGLAIIEALLCNCNLLLSDKVGVTSVLENLNDSDIIFDVDNIDEIASKIVNKLETQNYKRIQNGLNYEAIDYIQSANKLFNKIEEYCKN